MSVFFGGGRIGTITFLLTVTRSTSEEEEGQALTMSASSLMSAECSLRIPTGVETRIPTGRLKHVSRRGG